MTDENKPDGSSTIKVYFHKDGFEIWEKAWHIPRVGEFITKEGKMYEVMVINYRVEVLWHVEIFTRCVGRENYLEQIR